MLVCAAGCSPAADPADQQETETTEQPDQQGVPETRAVQGKQPPQSNSTKVTPVIRFLPTPDIILDVWLSYLSYIRDILSWFFKTDLCALLEDKQC